MRSIKAGIIAIYLYILGKEWLHGSLETPVDIVTGLFGLATILLSFVCLLICIAIPADKGSKGEAP